MRHALWFKLIFVVVTINLCAASTAHAQVPVDSDPRIFLEKARASMVLITGENESGQPITPGAGFVIGRNHIATHLGIVSSARRIRVQPAGQEQKVDVSTRDDNGLAAILTVARVDGPPLKLGYSGSVALNDKVYILGYTNNGVEVSEALITKVDRAGDTPSFQISSQITSSSKGGPVLNSKGEVIGIAGDNAAGLSQGIVVPVLYLSNLLPSVTGSGGGIGAGAGSGGGIGPGLPSVGAGQGPGVLQPGDRSPATTASSVDTRPILIKRVNPGYTEEARKNNIQGIVTLRVLVGADGAVKRVMITRGLPDGLNERAIAAAYQATFKPAMKDGQPVEYWVGLQMEFNLK